LEWGQVVLLDCDGIHYEFPVYDTGAGSLDGVVNIDIPDQSFKVVDSEFCILYAKEGAN